MSTKQHSVYTVDFKKTQHNICFVEIAGYDAASKSEFQAVIKFLNGMPFGDILHPVKSSLSPDCREFVQAFVLDQYHSGNYNEDN